MLKLTGILALVLAAQLWTAEAAFCAAQPKGARIEISKGMTFERYLTTGNSAQMESSLERISQLALSEPFLAFVKGIDFPLVIVAYTDLSCPDCARTIPFVHAISQANPLVDAAYFLRDDSTRPFMRAQTGKSSIPTIFVTDRSGFVAGDVYVEYPEKVQALIDASSSDDEARRHKNDLRSGLYDEEIEKGLRELIESAMAELKTR
jgi:hypothetical protein